MVPTRQFETNTGEVSARVLGRLEGIEDELRVVRGFLERLVRVEERREADARALRELQETTARHEVQLTGVLNEVSQLRGDLDEVSKKLNSMTPLITRTGFFLGWVERSFWVLVTAGAGLVAAILGGRWGAK